MRIVHNWRTGLVRPALLIRILLILGVLAVGGISIVLNRHLLKNTAKQWLAHGDLFVYNVVYQFNNPSAKLLTPLPPEKSMGPLRVSRVNPRYFTDESGKAILLVGSHTWSNFIDSGKTDPPVPFTYVKYLDDLQKYHHNFIRLWRAENAKGGEASPDYWFFPMPYPRPGPGMAWDNKPKFDLNQFSQAYFDRMRERVIQAGQRSMYVSIMLFDGWSVENKIPNHQPWLGHPFNANNNINGIDGDSNGNGQGREVHTAVDQDVLALQQTYVRKVIDTVNDLDNVLYEIVNEDAGTTANRDWQYAMIAYIKNYQATKAKQHPVGMSGLYPSPNNDYLFASPADWIAPSGNPPLNWQEPMFGSGAKVILNDTDHLCGVCGVDRTWVWKSFTRGLNPIFMDQYDGVDDGRGSFPNYNPNDPTDVSVRLNLGYALTFAEKMNLVAMTPRGTEIASSNYVLASSSDYLVYLPKGGSVQVNLTATPGTLTVEWFNPNNGTTIDGGAVLGGTHQSFTPPFSGDAVLFLSAKSS